MVKPEFVVWKDEYAVGHRDLDKHHDAMFTIINTLYDDMANGATDEEMTVLFRKALEYAKLHFRREESVLRAAGYPRLPDQQHAHREYAERVEALVGAPRGGTRAEAAEVLSFLRDWWENHIVQMDHEYRSVLSGQIR